MTGQSVNHRYKIVWSGGRDGQGSHPGSWGYGRRREREMILIDHAELNGVDAYPLRPKELGKALFKWGLENFPVTYRGEGIVCCKSSKVRSGSN